MQIFNCYTPSWFSGMAISLELLFAIVTMLIALFAYRAYKVVQERDVLLFGIAFFSIGLGYLQEVIYNASQLFSLTRYSLSPIIGPVANTMNIGFMVALIHMITFIFGLSLLVYLILPRRNKKLFVIIAGLGLIGLFTSSNIVLTFFLINSLMLLALTLHYYQLFLKKNSKSSLYNFIGFGSIFLGQLQLAIATQEFSTLYIASHITTLFGFILLLLNLFRVMRK